MQFINCNGTDKIVPYDYYRIALSISFSIILREADEDKQFKLAFDSIQSKTALVPTGNYSRAPGETAIVVDCKARGSANETVAQAASIVNDASLLASVVSVERLLNTPGITSASDRQTIIDKITATPSAFAADVTGIFSGVGDTVKWALIIGGVVLGSLLLKDVVDEW